MLGTVIMQLSTPLCTFRLELRRNITIIKDEGATGKSCLCAWVDRYYNTRGTVEGKDIQYTATSNVQPRLLTQGAWRDGDYKHWTQPMLLFIDESWHIAETREFANFVQQSPHYFVIISRNLNKLRGLTFSVNSIMSLTGDKLKYLIPWSESAACKQGAKIQRSGDLWHRTAIPVKPNKIITEDSNTGYQFFHAICGDDCVPSGGFEEGKPAGGKNKVVTRATALAKDVRNFVLVFADGAAYGGELEYMLMNNLLYSNVAYYLYESFEWLLLQTPAIYKSSPNVRAALQNPKVDSCCYLSWERYYTAVLIQASQNTYGYAYNKAQLAQGYLQKANVAYLLSLLHGVSFEHWQNNDAPAKINRTQQRDKNGDSNPFAHCNFVYRPLQWCIDVFKANAGKTWFCKGTIRVENGKTIQCYWFYRHRGRTCWLYDAELVNKAVACEGERILKADALPIIERLQQQVNDKIM